MRGVSLHLTSGGSLLVSSKKQKKLFFIGDAIPGISYKCPLPISTTDKSPLRYKIIRIPDNLNLRLAVYQHLVNQIPDFICVKFIKQA